MDSELVIKMRMVGKNGNVLPSDMAAYDILHPDGGILATEYELDDAIAFAVGFLGDVGVKRIVLEVEPRNTVLSKKGDSGDKVLSEVSPGAFIEGRAHPRSQQTAR